MASRNRTNRGSLTVSQNVVKYLQKKHHLSLKQIGELMGLGESFISLVGKGRRALTMQRLLMLEETLGEPLAVILAEATPVDSAPPKLRPFYAAFREFVSSFGESTGTGSQGAVAV